MKSRLMRLFPILLLGAVVTCSVTTSSAEDPELPREYSFQEDRSIYWSVAFSPDSSMVAASFKRLPDSFFDQGRGIRIGGIRLLNLAKMPVVSSEISPDSDYRYFLSESPQAEIGTPEASEIRFVRRQSMKPANVTLAEAKNHQITIGAIATDGTLQINHAFETASDKSLGKTELSRNGELLATCRRNFDSDEFGDVSGYVILWDVKSGKPLLDHKWDQGGYHSVALSHDGGLLAAGGGHVVPNIIVFDDGSKLVGGGDKFRGRLMIWDTRSKDVVMLEDFADHKIESLTFASDASFLISGGNDGVVRVWDVETGKVNKRLLMQRPDREPKELLGGTRITSLNYSPDGKHLAVTLGSWNRGGHWGAVRIFETQNWELKATLLKKHPDIVTAGSFSPDGRRFAAVTADGQFMIWNILALSDD